MFGKVRVRTPSSGAAPPAITCNVVLLPGERPGGTCLVPTLQTGFTKNKIRWFHDAKLPREHSIFSVVLTEAVAPYYVEAWRRASVNTLEKIECSLKALFCRWGFPLEHKERFQPFREFSIHINEAIKVLCLPS